MQASAIRIDTKKISPTEVAAGLLEWMQDYYARNAKYDSTAIRFDECTVGSRDDVTCYTFYEWVPVEGNRLSSTAYLYVRDGDNAVYVERDEHRFVLKAITAIIQEKLVMCGDV